jgi:OmpA-OmpF porin, OOP family
MKTANRIFLLFSVFFIVSACASAQTASSPTNNPEQLVNQLEANLAEARSQDVNVLSPGLYNQAQSSLLTAKQALDRGGKLSAIEKYVAEGKDSLQKAETIAQVSRTILGETNNARAKALKVGADQLGEPYMDVERQYLELTKAIENDNLSYAQKNALEVQGAFRKLEIMAIKKSALGNARKMMVDADKAKLQKIAPLAYDAAKQALNEADTYAGQNPYAAEMISQKNLHAEFMARRLIAISESSKKFQPMTPESSAIYVENLLAQLGQSLNTGDIRDKNVDAQLGTLAAAAGTMERNNQALEKEKTNFQHEIAALEQKLAGVQGVSREQAAAKSRLSAESAFNEQFNTVQRYFDSDEAEVYKQGGNLVIRLRGIKFPVGQATLTPDNYTLLSKVQRAIQTFDQPKVTIEGHTDSTGSTQTNQELSQKRSEAVKTYLVANKTLPKNQIQAAGFGPDRPLAPNTTPEGRAINRRIDVLISPTQAP